MDRTRILGTLLLVGALSLAGCSSRDDPVRPSVHALSGSVVLIGYVTAADGTFLGTRVVADADGVPVALLGATQVVARTTTVRGKYRFEGLRPGTYVARSDIFGPVLDQTTVLTIATYDVVSADTLRLASAGDIFPTPNPLGATGSTYHYEVPDSELVRVRIRDVKGDHVRFLANGWMPAGSITSFWSGRDSLGQVVPGTLFWVTFESGPDQRAQLVFR